MRTSTNQRDFVVAVHRRAKLDYLVLNSVSAGMVLVGSEVKSLRLKACQIQDSYVIISKGEVYLQNLHINAYHPSGDRNHALKRKRKLLLKKEEIQRLTGQIQQKGLSCIPLKIYFKNHKVKVELALVKGRKKGDKREYIKKKEMAQLARTALRRNRR